MILEKWVTQERKSDLYGFETTLRGLQFGDHPFKIKEVSCSAPVIFTENLDEEEREFELTLSISPGVICDLSRYEGNVKIPLYVANRGGQYIAFKAQEKEIINIGPLSIPVAISLQYVIPMKTRGARCLTLDGSGMLFLEVVFQDLTTVEEHEAAQIVSASILTAQELKDKYPGTTIDNLGAILPPELSGQVRTIIFYSAEASAYSPTNAPSKAVMANASEELKKQQETEGALYYVFQSRPGPPVLKDNLFLRIR